MMEEATFEREMKSLRNITDNYPKTVLTLDRFTIGDYDGIEVVNVVDWLLNWWSKCFKYLCIFTLVYDNVCKAKRTSERDDLQGKYR